jgi:starvation-inducible DNA-binding protein
LAHERAAFQGLPPDARRTSGSDTRADRSARRAHPKGGRIGAQSIGHIARTQRILDNDAEYVEPLDMLAELREDDKKLASRLREAHNVCNEHRDIASASLIEVWIDEAEGRTGFLAVWIVGILLRGRG